MIKVYKKLTDEQKKKGVIFCSCLSKYRTEELNDRQHEVFKINENDFKNKPSYEFIKARDEQQETINRLKDDKFFNKSNFKFNIIRT